MDIFGILCPISKGKRRLGLSVSLLVHKAQSENEASLEEHNLLFQEQIVSFLYWNPIDKRTKNILIYLLPLLMFPIL